jgi:hypothetical protein
MLIIIKMIKVPEIIRENPKISVGVILAIVCVIIFAVLMSKSGFYDTLTSPGGLINTDQPLSFPPLSTTPPGTFPLMEPVVPEEIGLAMVYPQGSGVGMEKSDSNSFEPGNPGPLLTDYVNPESYGQSSLTDPMGSAGASQGCRVIKLNGTGNQMNFKPMDDSEKETFSAAYTKGEVQEGHAFVNGGKSINYSDNFNPENNLSVETSPGQSSTLKNCEKTYPNVVKYGDLCITEGDIPYGKVVNGKVNPRLVSRWESYTGEYSRSDALNPIDGVLYPNLSVLV